MEHAGHLVSVSVRDTGVGIAPEDMQRIFEPFTQVDQSMTRRATGTGLGLSVSRQLAEMMGGTLTATSTKDQGSTFTLTLPADTDRLRAGTAPAGSAEQAWAREA